MRIRPGKTRSLIAGIASIVVMIVGLVMMTRFGGFGVGIARFLWPFAVAWVLITLIGAGISFYNAFSDRGVSLYRVDMDQEAFDAGFCPQCGRPIGERDEYCRHCGAKLKE